MRTRTRAIGLAVAILAAGALPAMGGVDTASAHVGHTSCGDHGQWVASTQVIDDGAPGSSDHGLSDAASRQGTWEGMPPTFWAGTVELLHLGFGPLIGIPSPGCDTGP